MSARAIHVCLRRTSYRGVCRPACRTTLKAVLPATLERTEKLGITRIVGWLLGEPERSCRRILREFLYQRAIAAKRWADVMNRRVSVAEVTDHVILQDQMDIGHFLQSRERGLVVTTYHAGDYLAALLKLATLLPPGRCIHVLRRSDGRTRDANRVLPTLLPSIRVVLDDDHGLRVAVRALRGGDLLAVLCDLPRSWGAAAPVTLFGRSLVWTRSAVDFAKLGRADLLPLTSHLTAGGTCVATAHPLMPAEHHRDLSPMHQLGRIAEQQIRGYPGQWHQWPLVPEMLPPSGTGDSAGE
jgi:lauroyl/myristoyl acyltransferase